MCEDDIFELRFQMFNPIQIFHNQFLLLCLGVEVAMGGGFTTGRASPSIVHLPAQSERASNIILADANLHIYAPAPNRRGH